VNSCQSLQSLDLSFESTILDSKRHRDRWQPTLFRIHFSCLDSLRLSDLPIAEGLLCSFLLSHSATLRRLSILRCNTRKSKWVEDAGDELDPWGSVHKILTTFRDNLKLEKFHIRLSHERSVDEVHLHGQDWFRAKGTLNSNINFWSRGDLYDFDLLNESLLENYVRGLCPWPMKQDSPDDDGDWGRLPEYEVMRWLRVRRYSDNFDDL
jgi:hypothetical protein